MNWLFKLRSTKIGGQVCDLFRRLVPPLRVWRTVWGKRVFLNLRDCLFYLAMSRRELESLEGPVLDALRRSEGAVWDIGCNVGFFSIYCAAQGHAVTAFDISDSCIRLLTRSASYNGLAIQTVPTALSVEPFEFAAPQSAHATNSLYSSRGRVIKKSMTFNAAAVEFGVPRLIKMDIEGAELDFFCSQEFKSWISENSIRLLVEIHNDEIWKVVWNDLPLERLDERHVLISPATVCEA